jgi:hypothetical protein
MVTIGRPCRFYDRVIEIDYEITDREMARCTDYDARALFRKVKREAAERECEIERAKHERACIRVIETEREERCT